MCIFLKRISPPQTFYPLLSSTFIFLIYCIFLQDIAFVKYLTAHTRLWCPPSAFVVKVISKIGFASCDHGEIILPQHSLHDATEGTSMETNLFLCFYRNIDTERTSLIWHMNFSIVYIPVIYIKGNRNL